MQSSRIKNANDHDGGEAVSVEVIHEADLQAMRDSVTIRDLTISRLEKDIEVLKHWLKQAHDEIEVLQHDNRDMKVRLGEWYGVQV